MVKKNFSSFFSLIILQQKSICMHLLGRHKLNFGGCMGFESTFEAFKSDNFPFYLLHIASFDSLLRSWFCFVYVFLLE